MQNQVIMFISKDNSKQITKLYTTFLSLYISFSREIKAKQIMPHIG